MPAVTAQSAWAKGRRNVASPSNAGVTVFERFEIDAPALAAGDILEIGVLPAECTIVDAILDTDDLDSHGTPTLTLDVGLIDGDVGDSVSSRTCGNELFAASDVGQAGGVARMSKQAGFRVAKTRADRSIGVKAAAGAATGVAGKIYLIVIFGQ